MRARLELEVRFEDFDIAACESDRPPRALSLGRGLGSKMTRPFDP
jgi:hypothetical protein